MREGDRRIEAFGIGEPWPAWRGCSVMAAHRVQAPDE